MAGRGKPKRQKRFPPLRFNSPSSSKTEQPSQHGWHSYLGPVAVPLPPPQPPIVNKASAIASLRQAKQEASPPPPIKHVKQEASHPRRLSPRLKLFIMPMQSAEPASSHKALEISPPEGPILRSADAVSSKSYL